MGDKGGERYDGGLRGEQMVMDKRGFKVLMDDSGGCNQ